jgi:hypothetical protein
VSLIYIKRLKIEGKNLKMKKNIYIYIKLKPIASPYYYISKFLPAASQLTGSVMGRSGAEYSSYERLMLALGVVAIIGAPDAYVAPTRSLGSYRETP